LNAATGVSSSAWKDSADTSPASDD
jgi:hypothetical protein